MHHCPPQSNFWGARVPRVPRGIYATVFTASNSDYLNRNAFLCYCLKNNNNKLRCLCLTEMKKDGTQQCVTNDKNKASR